MMNEELERLESVIARLLESYNTLKTDNEKLSDQLVELEDQLARARTENRDVRSRLEALAFSLENEIGGNEQ